MAFSTSFLSAVAASGGLTTAARNGPPAAAGDPATGAASPGAAGFGSLLQQVTTAGETAVPTALPPGVVRQLALALDGGKLATDGRRLPGEGTQLPLDALATTAASTGILASATGVMAEGEEAPAEDEGIDPLAGFDWLTSMGLPAEKVRTTASTEAAATLPAGPIDNTEPTPAELTGSVTPLGLASSNPGQSVAAAPLVAADAQALMASGTGTDAQGRAFQSPAQPVQLSATLPAAAGDAVNAATATGTGTPLGGQLAQGKSGEGDFARLVQAIETEAGGAVAEAGTSDTGANGLREPAARSSQPGAAATAQVQVPVGRPGWSEAVLEKVMWFSSQFIDSAEIQLSPPELGPVQVRISTQHEQASVYFASHNAAVRDALDQALPRLRELFENQGLQLADAGVGERSSAEQRAFQQGERGGQGEQRSLSGDDTAGELATDAPAVLTRVGLVDAYV